MPHDQLSTRQEVIQKIKEFAQCSDYTAEAISAHSILLWSGMLPASDYRFEVLYIAAKIIRELQTPERDDYFDSVEDIEIPSRITDPEMREGGYTGDGFTHQADEDSARADELKSAYLEAL